MSQALKTDPEVEALERKVAELEKRVEELDDEVDDLEHEVDRLERELNGPYPESHEPNWAACAAALDYLREVELFGLGPDADRLRAELALALRAV